MAKIKMTERRKANLAKAFDRIDWDFEKAQLRRCGDGDRPQFCIPGRIGGYQVLYRQQSPNGFQAPLMDVWKDGQRVIRFNPAYQYLAEMIQDNLEIPDSCFP